MAALPPSLPEALTPLLQWIAHHVPGRVPEGTLTIPIRGSKEPLLLHFPDWFPTWPPANAVLPAPATSESAQGPTPARELPPARHSPDFVSVHWYGGSYGPFSPTQAAVVRILWEAWENGTPDMGQAAILEAANSDCGQLRDLFRNPVGDAAWGTLIAGSGATNNRTFRLNQSS